MILAAIAGLLLAATGCDQATPSAAPTPATTAATSRPRDAVVSLSPAATDLLLAMNLGDRLVGVSTFDDDPRVAGLPKVGDYENVDWERIAALAPQLMVVQIQPDRMPPGFRDRAAKLNVAIHTAKIDRYTDVAREAQSIWSDLGQPSAARPIWKTAQTQIDAIARAVDGKKKVRTLLVTSDDSLGVAGPETFLDDVLGFAGGENVLDGGRSGYGKIDRELLISLAPEAIVQFAPAATAAQREAIDRLWKSLPEVPAVKNGKVFIITEPWSLLPGSHLGDLADRIAHHLHPEAF